MGSCRWTDDPDLSAKSKFFGTDQQLRVGEIGTETGVEGHASCEAGGDPDRDGLTVLTLKLEDGLDREIVACRVGEAVETILDLGG